MVKNIEIPNKFHNLQFSVDTSAENFYGLPFWNSVCEGNYEKEQIDDIVTTLIQSKQKILFLDIGASCGIYSLAVGSLGIPVISVEPDQQQFIALIKNIALNPNFKISPYNSFLTGAQKAEFSAYSSHLKNSNLNTIRASDLINEREKHLIKIDIEGGEWKVLKDKEFIRKLKLTNSMVFLSVHVGFFSQNYYKNFLERLRYRLRYLDELLTLYRFSRRALKRQYQNREVKGLYLVLQDRIFGGPGFKNHIKLIF